MSQYKHVTYAPGCIVTTIKGLQELFPSLDISDDITQDELDKLEIPFDTSPLYQGLESRSKHLESI